MGQIFVEVKKYKHILSIMKEVSAMKNTGANKEKTKLFYSVKELAEILMVSKSFIYCKIEAKEFPSKRLGRRVLIPATFVTKLLAA